MSFIEIDICSNQEQANILAAKWKKLKRKNIRVTKAASVIVNDCTVTPPKQVLEKDGKPSVFLVHSDG